MSFNRLFHSYQIRTAACGAILGLLLIHPLVMGLEELFFIHPHTDMLLQWEEVWGATKAAFSQTHIPSATAFTILGFIAGFLYGTSIETYRKKLKAEKRYSFIGQDVTTIIHDIKNPLFAISSFAGLISEETESKALSEYADLITKSAKRIEILIGEMRVIASEKTMLPLHKKIINMHELISSIEKKLHLPLKSRIESDMIISGAVDPLYFERVIWNILSNAGEALQGRANPEIVVNIQSKQNVIIINISDNGPGIAKNIRKSLFDFGATYGKKSGTGIGLYVSRRIVEAHGGKIYLSRSESKGINTGTTFTIELPEFSETHNHYKTTAAVKR